MAFAVAGAYLASHLSLESDLAELLPDSYESVQALHRMQEQVGGIGQLRIVIESQDFDAVRRFVLDLEPLLMASPFINYVDHGDDVSFYERNALLFLDTAALDSLRSAVDDAIQAEKQRVNPLMVDDLFGSEDRESGDTRLKEWENRLDNRRLREFYTNDDSTVVVVKIFPAASNTDVAFIRNMLSDVRNIVASLPTAEYDPAMNVYYGGNFKNRLDELEVVQADILGTALYGVGGVFLLIALYFRRLSGAILISLSLLCSLAWTFGLTYVVVGQLNTITGFLFVILFGLGVDYGIHAFARYVEGRRFGLNREQAIEKMVRRTGAALATTAVTTSAAFFSLMVMDFRGFSDLGFIAGTGILFAFVATVIVLPSLIVLFEEHGLLRVERGVSTGESPFTPGAFRHWRIVLVVAAPTTVVAAYGFMQTDFEYDFTNLRALTPERRTVSEITKGIFTLSESPAVIMADSRDEVDEIVRTVEARARQDTRTPTIDVVRSVFSLVPEDQDARLARIAQIRDLVTGEAVEILDDEERARVQELLTYLDVERPFTWKEFPQKDKRQFLTKDGDVGNFVFVYPSVPLRDGRNAIAFREDVGTITTPSGRVYHAASSNIISAEMLTVIIREGKLAAVLTLVVVFFLVLIDFRNLTAVALVLCPLVVGVIWMGGAMYVAGMKFNLFNIVVFPSVIGIGVDHGVHLYHRYLEEGRGSLPFVLRHTGVAVSITTLTTITGYSGLIVASHPGLNSIGTLAVVGLITTFVTAVTVLPAVIQWLEHRPQTRTLAVRRY
jgi:predicted RND superfamily exporter protein